MKCHIMQHFIYVFTVCHSTHLGVWDLQRINNKKVSEYDQEIPQSQTADKPMAPRGRATQQS